jgi:hypothetical protein
MPDRERHMHEVALANADAGKRAAPGEKAVGNVVGGARIKDWLAGRAARSPEFRDLGVWHRAELLHEAGVIEGAQDVLVEDRDGLPHGRIVEPVGSIWSSLPRYQGSVRARSKATRLRSRWISAISARDFGNGSGSGAGMKVPDRCPVAVVSAGSRPDAIPQLQILARDCRDRSRRGLQSMTADKEDV